MKVLKCSLLVLAIFGAIQCTWTISRVLLAAPALNKFEQVGLASLVAWWALFFVMDIVSDMAKLSTPPTPKSEKDKLA